MIKVAGKTVTVRRAVWELGRGPLTASERVLACPDDAACVRLEHLRLGVARSSQPRPSVRKSKGGGSVRLIRTGVWELSVTTKYADGASRRVYRTVSATSRAEAVRQLAAFVAEVDKAPAATRGKDADLTVDAAIAQYLVHLREDKGREDSTIDEYAKLHAHWFAAAIGRTRLSKIDSRTIDRLFGKMRAAGLSRSRMNHAKSLYAPFFRWAKRNGLIFKNPMAEFELPTSTQVSRERVPPEAEELSLLLATAAEVVPEVVPVLVLAAVTGMRRGELVGIRRNSVDWARGRLTIDTAVSESGQIKTTKTRQARTFHVDTETLSMLERHCRAMDERAELFGAAVDASAFLFSLEPDCSRPISPDFVTRRVRVLKSQLGIEDKTPAVIALEDEALRLFRSTPASSARRGPAPKGGMSFREIGECLRRSEKWASLAVGAAERREAASASGATPRFDGSILALRKFTSSELLDAGFNISVVAKRQGHGTQVLARHYSKSRESADRKAAEHLGSVVHGQRLRGS